MEFKITDVVRNLTIPLISGFIAWIQKKFQKDLYAIVVDDIALKNIHFVSSNDTLILFLERNVMNLVRKDLMTGMLEVRKNDYHAYLACAVPMFFNFLEKYKSIWGRRKNYVVLSSYQLAKILGIKTRKIKCFISDDEMFNGGGDGDVEQRRRLMEEFNKYKIKNEEYGNFSQLNKKINEFTEGKLHMVDTL